MNTAQKDAIKLNRQKRREQTRGQRPAVFVDRKKKANKDACRKGYHGD